MEESTFRALLHEERTAALTRLQALSSELDDIVTASINSNNDDEHDPEGATIAFERTRVATLLARTRAYLEDLDRAQTRLATGTYSECERCGAQIDSDRLAARPTASTCIDCAASVPPDRGPG
jgi:RNA polymerase-binding transcription factor DksA